VFKGIFLGKAEDDFLKLFGLGKSAEQAASDFGTIKDTSDVAKETQEEFKNQCQKPSPK
jgi:hypothetical protein